ncbi:MAG: putative nucleotidyltransferase substrate binding domain-containing protein [Burkholderiaceae bacterium]|nr:putative nucleotidyltransferase substrate binding domain-containing protein [Burkholderiaceae bacterium]
MLNANIFFDFRALYGDSTLADDLAAWLLARTQDNKLFLRLMVANALQTEPPLGLIRAFEVGSGPEGDGKLDLKTRGTRLFVDAARVFALGQGVAQPSTLDRMRRAGEFLAVDARHVSATVEAFNFLQVMRLRTQDRSHEGAPNRIDPYALNEVEQRMLKEAFRQARKLQQRLKETYAFSL